MFFTLFLCVSLSSSAFCQDADNYEQDLLFITQEPINITLSANFRKLFDDRGDDRSYHKASLSFLDYHEDTIFRSVKLKTRGNFRRDPANCKYPPISVKFGKRVTGDSIFSHQSKLKLVIQCQIEKYVLLEYLAYRIYNVITDNSYRVRLAHITYTDNNNQEAYATKYGFFIESDEQLKERLGAEIYKPNVVQYFLPRQEIITMALFQYLIGNNDWYLTSKHNMTVMREETTNHLLAIPYDFDWSKLVDADYTKPSNVADHLIKDRRVYKGLCMNEDDMREQRKIFNQKKDEILSLVSEIPNLSTKEQRQTKSFIEQFYKTINKSSSIYTAFQKEECIQELDVPGQKKPD